MSSRRSSNWRATPDTRGATVVTEEKLNLEKKKKVLIPNVCVGLGVPYVDNFEMLRALSTRFEWEP